MVVAFPEYAFGFKYDPMFTEFMSAVRHPASILVLLLTDIGIAVGILKDFRVRDGLSDGNRLGFVILLLLIFLLAAIFLPTFNEPFVKVHALIVGGSALVSLGVMRALSYSPPQRARRLRPPAAQIPPVGGGP